MTAFIGCILMIQATSGHKIIDTGDIRLKLNGLPVKVWKCAHVESRKVIDTPLIGSSRPKNRVIDTTRPLRRFVVTK
jgi:hypothetical protein